MQVDRRKPGEEGQMKDGEKGPEKARDGRWGWRWAERAEGPQGGHSECPT